MAQEAKKSRFAIVTVIMAALNLGEAGKLESFFGRLVKKFNGEIKILKQNKSTDAMTIENDITSVKDQLEDAQSDLMAAYADVDVEKLDSNASQDAHGEEYIAKIEMQEKIVERLETRLEELEKSLEVSNGKYDKKIKVRTERINKISK
jgi:hypothetical protein